MNRLTITRPDDWHLHLRDGPEMRSVVGFTARQFGRAIVMPNLDPPVISTAQAQAYRDRRGDIFFGTGKIHRLFHRILKLRVL